MRIDIFTSIHIEEFELQVRDTKRGEEELTREIPNVSEEATKDLDENGIIRIGAEVNEGDILIGKITPKGETDPTPEEKFLKAIFGEKAGDVKDASLKAPPGIKGIVISTKLFSRKKKDTESKREDKKRLDALDRVRRKELKELSDELSRKLGLLLAGEKSNGIRDTDGNVVVRSSTLIKEDTFVEMETLDGLGYNQEWVDDPIHWRLVAPLIEGLRANLVVRDDAAKRIFPQIKPIDFQTAVHLALNRIQRDNVETSWMDALVTAQGDLKPYVFTVEEGMFVERRQVMLDLPTETVFRSYAGIGGERGWLYMDWSWAMRGWMDKVVGGVGLRRGRRHPDEARVGEALDFWRVEEGEPNRLLRLRAEMKLPGKAWLEFKSDPQGDKTLPPAPSSSTRGELTQDLAPTGVLVFRPVRL